jgi:hypothetical protein
VASDNGGIWPGTSLAVDPAIDKRYLPCEWWSNSGCRGASLVEPAAGVPEGFEKWNLRIWHDKSTKYRPQYLLAPVFLATTLLLNHSNIHF